MINGVCGCPLSPYRYIELYSRQLQPLTTYRYVEPSSPPVHVPQESRMGPTLGIMILRFAHAHRSTDY